MKNHALKVLLVAVCLVPAYAAENGNPFRGHHLKLPPADAPNPFSEAPVRPDVAARLDGLVAAHDWRALSTATMPTKAGEIASVLNWLKLKVDTGGSFLMAMLYTRNLWQIGDAVHEGDLKEGLTKQAVLMALYTVALIRMDGAACGDISAPEHRLDQLTQNEVGAALRYGKTLPRSDTYQMLRIAVELEAATGRQREVHDEVLCSGGAEEIKAGLDAGNMGKPHEVDGYIGKVITVTPPSSWKPSFRSDVEVQSFQDKQRGADLYDYLASLLN